MKLAIVNKYLRVSLSVLAVMAISACNTVKPIEEPFAGLLPAGYKPAISQSRVDSTTLKASKLAIVPSANYEAMAKEWVAYFEGAGRKESETRADSLNAISKIISPMHLLFGGANDTKTGLATIEKQSDPRRVLRELVPTLIPRFAQVEVLTDIATAKERKADYILIVDYYGNYNGMGTKYLSKVGYHALDQSLKQVFTIERSATVDRVEPRSLLASVSDHMVANAQTIVNGINAAMIPAQQELREKLSGR